MKKLSALDAESASKASRLVTLRVKAVGRQRMVAENSFG